jgi:hypothetical protein
MQAYIQVDTQHADTCFAVLCCVKLCRPHMNVDPAMAAFWDDITVLLVRNAAHVKSHQPPVASCFFGMLLYGESAQLHLSLSPSCPENTPMANAFTRLFLVSCRMRRRSETPSSSTRRHA